MPLIVKCIKASVKQCSQSKLPYKTREAASLDYKDCIWTINNIICPPDSEHLEFAFLPVLEEVERRKDKRQQSQFNLGRLHSSSKEHFPEAH